MKKCNNCKTYYTEETKKCLYCGETLVISEVIKSNKKTINRLKYITGIIVILINIIDISDIGIISILGFLFGLSLFPITYEILSKKINFFEKKSKLILVIPIVMGVLWLLLLPNEKIKEIKIQNLNNPIAVNEKVKVQFETNLKNIDGKKFTYKTSNKNIAEINEKGEIQGISEGKVTISIIGENKVSTKKEILIKYVEIENIKLNIEPKIAVGQSKKLEYEIKPKVSSEKIVEWKSLDSNIITITENGEIKAINQGKTKIYALSDKGKKYYFDLQAYVEVEKIEISHKNLKLEKKKTAQLKAAVYPTNADYKDLTWSSSNTSVATVDKKGLVTAVGEGKAIIYAESNNGIEVTSNVEVYEIKATSIKANKTKITLMKGKTAKISVTISPSNTSDKNVTWISSNSLVASVKNGVITAERAGTTTITAMTSNGKTAEIEVNVKEKAPITIKGLRYTKDYVCGIEWTFSITNNTKKEIKYITLKWYNFNSVGDYVYDQIDGKNYTALRYTGPLKAGKNSGKRRNTTKFYNCNYKSSTMSEISIEYSDGTTETIYNSDFYKYDGLIK